MARRPRLFVPGATYHICSRVARGEFAFSSAGEAREFLRIACRVRDLEGWRVLAWCLMGNHYHLVVSTSDSPLWRSMLRLQGRVARGFNRRRRYRGRLWQSRYRARVIDSPEYLRQVIAYVHLNPVAAGIVDDPAAYAYSGHRAALGRCPAGLLNVQGLLKVFGGAPWGEARLRYLAWLRAVAEERWFRDNVEKLPWWSDAQEVDEVADARRHPDAIAHDGRPPEITRPRLGVEEVLQRYEKATGCTSLELTGRCRSEQLLAHRVALTLLAVDRYRVPCSALARVLKKDPSSVSRWLAAGLERQHDDPDFRARVEVLDGALASR